MKTDLDQPLVLSQAEMALLYSMLFDERAVGDAGLDLEAAQASLLERELLLMPPGRQQPVLNPSLAPILGTVTEPQVLAVLELSARGAEPRTTYFSWSPERIVSNWLTAEDQHHLESLASVQAIAEQAVEQSGAKRFARASKAAAQDPEQLLRAAERRAVLLVVTDLYGEQQSVGALSWVESGDRLWLVDAEAEGANGRLLRPASASRLREAITAAIQGAIQQAP